MHYWESIRVGLPNSSRYVRDWIELMGCEPVEDFDFSWRLGAVFCQSLEEFHIIFRPPNPVDDGFGRVDHLHTGPIRRRSG